MKIKRFKTKRDPVAILSEVRCITMFMAVMLRYHSSVLKHNAGVGAPSSARFTENSVSQEGGWKPSHKISLP